MDAAGRLGGSEWFRARFGDAAHAVAAALIRAGRAAHDTSADTKATSGLPTDEPYGATFWQVLAINVIEELAEVEDVRKIRPKGSRFELPVIGGTIIYAAKCASQSGPEAGHLVIRWSQFRDGLLADVERRPEEYLPLAEWQGDQGNEEFPFPASERDAVVLVAFVASDRTGLERIHIGDGYLDADGAVIWIHHEELPVAVALDTDVVGEAGESRRFDEAPMRTLDMDIREDDDLSAGNQ
jgi:hypothetical protein